MKYAVLKNTFYLQNLHFYQNFLTDTAEPLSTVYNGIIRSHLFWHETAQIKQNPIVHNFKKTLQWTAKLCIHNICMHTGHGKIRIYYCIIGILICTQRGEMGSSGK